MTHTTPSPTPAQSSNVILSFAGAIADGLNSHETAITCHTARLAHSEARLVHQEISAADHNRQLATHESRLAAVEAGNSLLNEGLSILEASGLDARVASIEHNQKVIIEYLTRQHRRFDEIDEMLIRKRKIHLDLVLQELENVHPTSASDRVSDPDADNEVAHSGLVLNDREAIRQIRPDDPHLAGMKKAFRALYRIDFELADQHLDYAPRRVLQCFNILGDTFSLEVNDGEGSLPWDDVRHRLRTGCRILAQTWLDSRVGVEAMFPEVELDLLYADVCAWRDEWMFEQQDKTFG